MKAVRGVLAAAVLVASVSGLRAEDDGQHIRPALLQPGGFILFYGGAGPMSYPSATPRDVPAGATLLGEVRSHGCQNGVSIPLQLSPRAESLSAVVGDAGYVKAVRQIQQEHPGLDGLFDVRIDRHVISILGIYRRACTEVAAHGFSNPL